MKGTCLADNIKQELGLPSPYKKFEQVEEYGWGPWALPAEFSLPVGMANVIVLGFNWNDADFIEYQNSVGSITLLAISNGLVSES